MNEKIEKIHELANLENSLMQKSEVGNYWVKPTDLMEMNWFFSGTPQTAFYNEWHRLVDACGWNPQEVWGAWGFGGLHE